MGGKSVKTRIDPLKNVEIFSAIGIRKDQLNSQTFYINYTFLPDPYGEYINKTYLSFHFYNKFLFIYLFIF
jgi:hypothetical protein